MPIILDKKYPNNLYLAVWEITESHDELQSLLPSEILTDAELAMIHHPQKQIEFFASRLSIEYLAHKLGFAYKGIKKDEFGKPFLVGTHWQMSITHSLKLVAVVMHATKQVGIDLEKPSEKIKRIEHKFLSESEIKDADSDLKKLCIYWSAKEVLYKIYGKRKVFFIENLWVYPFDKNDKIIKGKITMPHYTNEIVLWLEDIKGYQLVVG
jgi:4'-phosphopantetheinyl transferase